MNPALKERLKEWKQDYQEVRKKPKKRRTEHFTESEMKDLMNVNKPTYRRHRGAFRQR